MVACALARPDIGLNIRNGYQYQPPATSYGTPTGSYLPGGSGGQTYQQSSSSQSFVSSGNGGYNSNANTGNGGFSDSTLNVQDYARSGSQGGFSGFNQQSGGGFQQQSGGFSQQSGGGYQQQGGFQQAQTQVHKHVYFYDSPEDLPAPTIRLSGGASAAQKNYKIIFIKAPAYQAPQVPQIPTQSQNEEKTLVYVLVKKPDDAQDIVVPTLAPSKPSKPEVFFIKYKTQKEAEQHVQTIQQGSHSGVSANAVDNDSAFISTITDSKVSSGGHSGNIGGGGVISNTNDYNSQIFGGGNVGGGHSSQENHFEATHTSSQVTSGNNGQKYGPAGASGPY